MAPELFRECLAAFDSYMPTVLLARALGVSERTVERYASGKSKIPPDMANKMIDAIASRELQVIEEAVKHADRLTKLREEKLFESAAAAKEKS